MSTDTDAAAKATADAAAATKATADKATADAATAAKATADAAAKKTADDAAAAAAAPKDGKTTETDDAAKAAAAAAAAKTAPEKYDLKAPDGGRIDTADLARIEQTARAAGWTNDEAQAVIAQIDADMQTQAAAFLATTKADKDYGGEKLAESQTLAKAAIDRLRPVGHPRRDAFLAFLNKGGAGNHLEVLAILADLGKLMREDSPLSAGAAGGAKDNKSVAERMYPSMGKK